MSEEVDGTISFSDGNNDITLQVVITGTGDKHCRDMLVKRLQELASECCGDFVVDVIVPE